MAHGIVDVSLHVAAGVAHAAISGEAPRPNEYVSVVPGARATTFALLAGFSVERELIDALALRLTMDVANASFSKVDTLTYASDGTRTGGSQSSRNLGLSLSPAVLLQFYF
jgi:hypothetical protein